MGLLALAVLVGLLAPSSTRDFLAEDPPVDPAP